jgi:adenine-specific DNA methylase
MKDNHNRCLIEVSLSLKPISAQSAREKSIRHGHISALHIWWARRPLAAMRAAIFASLIPAIQEARALICQTFPDRLPHLIELYTLVRRSAVRDRRPLPRRRRNTTRRGVNACPSPTPTAKA